MAIILTWAVSPACLPACLPTSQVYVVELTRKPLFPGIYTPVLINKNEKLIKEIMETKKQGSVEQGSGFWLVVQGVERGCPLL